MRSLLALAAASAGRRRAHALSGMLLVLAGCGGQGATSPSPGPAGPVDNEQPISVGFGPANNTINGLFVSVTVCVPGTTSCQTIDNVQVDTGSVGLRILASQLRLELPPVSDGVGHPIANCASYADLSYTWGQVVTADVAIAGEKAAVVPIQLVGAAGFPAAPAVCSNGGTAADSVDALSANGLLGIGVFRQDCGPACSDRAASAPPVYFSCSGFSCSVTSVPLGSQLQNPVWLFPRDNNGFLITLPAVPNQGAPTVSGSLVFGIGTQTNNSLGTARVYTTDDVGNFSTTFNGSTYSASYLDTGSNGLYFLDPASIGLPACPGEDSGYACPPSLISYSATNTGRNGVSGEVSFRVENAELLFNTGNAAFCTLGGPDTGDFDWGLPFFYGRTIFVGIEGQAAGASVGPYWAY